MVASATVEAYSQVWIVLRVPSALDLAWFPPSLLSSPILPIGRPPHLSNSTAVCVQSTARVQLSGLGCVCCSRARSDSFCAWDGVAGEARRYELFMPQAVPFMSLQSRCEEERVQ